MLQLKLLLLIGIANGAPILAEKLLQRRLDQPLDFNIRFVDGRPLLGRSKTVRGIVAALLITAAGAPIIAFSAPMGALIGFGAMCGDLVSSFLKRRLGIPASGMAFGLDQIPEVLLPLLMVKATLGLEWLEIVKMTLLFVVFELLISRILFRMRIRKQPY